MKWKDMNASSSKNTCMSSVTVTDIETEDHGNTMADHDQNVEVHLSISPEKSVSMQNDDS